MTSKTRNFVSFSKTLFRIFSCFLFILLTLPASIAPANENTIEYDTSVAGQIVPTKETVIEVRNEQLDIEFQRLTYDHNTLSAFTGMSSAVPLQVKVTAKYLLYNPTRETLTPQIAFPIVRSRPVEQLKYIQVQGSRYYNQTLPEDVKRGVNSNVTLNGKPLPFEYVSFESLFEKERQKWAAEVRTWLSQWPELLRRIDEVDGSRIKNRSTGTIQSDFLRPKEGQDNLRYLSWGLKPSERDQALLAPAVLAAEFQGPPEKWDLDVLSFLYSQLKPEEEDGVQKFHERWGVDSEFLNPVSGKRYPIDPLDSCQRPHWTLPRLGKRIDFLHYQPTLPPGRSAVIRVQYSHLVDVDMYGNDEQGFSEPYTWQFQYILKISKNWSKFGPIQVRLSIPSNKYGYSMTLPMKFLGDSKGMDRFTYKLNGSEAAENILIGLVEGGIPGLKHSQAKSYTRTCWDLYQADPEGPFADDLLIRVALDLMDNVDNSGNDFWLDALGMSQQQVRSRSTEEALAQALINKIPETYNDRYLERMMLTELFPKIGLEVNYGMVHQLDLRLNRVLREEWTQYNRWYWDQFKKEPNKDDPDHLSAAHRWSNNSSLYSDIKRLCTQYLSNFERNEGFLILKDRNKRYQAVMAQAEMQYRLSGAHNLERELIDAVREDYPKFWALYENYKDLPESVELLRLLERGKIHSSTYQYKEMEQPFMVDLWRRVDEEVERRKINNEGFPSGLDE